MPKLSSFWRDSDNAVSPFPMSTSDVPVDVKGGMTDQGGGRQKGEVGDEVANPSVTSLPFEVRLSIDLVIL